MKFAMCNEFCVDWPVDRICKLAVDTGYDGIEFAPFTLAKDVYGITSAQRRDIRKMVSDHGLETVGLHWLLAKTDHLKLHINHPDEAVRERTLEYYRELIACCAEMGGTRMIHGSPGQRAVIEGESYEDTWQRTVDFFASVGPVAQEHGIILCVEPLAKNECTFITTKDEAVQLIEQVDHPNVGLILDCKAMCADVKPIPQLVKEAAEYLRHFHANDDTKSYPGTGTVDFTAALKALADIDYPDWVSIEVFDFNPPPEQIAREGLEHLKASLAEIA